MARRSTATAITQAVVYGFASGIGRQAARDAYSSATDSKLKPDYSKAICPVNSETREIIFDRIKKDIEGKLYYISIQTLPLVWYDKRWKKFREGALPDGTSKVATEVSYDKGKLDQIASEEGYTVVVKSTGIDDKEYRKGKSNDTTGWLLALLPWGILFAIGVILAQLVQ